MSENFKQRLATTKKGIGRSNKEVVSKINKTKIVEDIGECAICKDPTEKYCSKCVQVGIMHFYCSKQCQKLDWPIHKHFCAIESSQSHWRPILPAARIEKGISIFSVFQYLPDFANFCLTINCLGDNRFPVAQPTTIIGALASTLPTPTLQGKEVFYPLKD